MQHGGVRGNLHALKVDAGLADEDHGPDRAAWASAFLAFHLLPGTHRLWIEPPTGTKDVVAGLP